jgi:hypothetical protein
MKTETYAAARTRILAYLAANGWTIKSALKVPQAKCKGKPTLYFRAQAVYLDAHSLLVDIRGLTNEAFVSRVERMIAVNAQWASREYAQWAL